MKQLITLLLLFCCITASAQYEEVAGPKKPQKKETNHLDEKKDQTSGQTQGQGQKQTTGISWNSSTSSIVFRGRSYKMVSVTGGTFSMGATSEQGDDANGDEKPAHSVTLKNYYIGQTEVTQALWEAVMGSNPSKFKGENLPVEKVSWDDCQEFIRKLNSMTGKTFRLPTEAEWEYAARGGNKSKGYKYSGSNTLKTVAWFYDNSENVTHDVKTKSANELGLYDMSGNVCEWCQDWYGNYSSNSQANPSGASSGTLRVDRGGSYNTSVNDCRISSRDDFGPANSRSYVGLRLAL